MKIKITGTIEAIGGSHKYCLLRLRDQDGDTLEVKFWGRNLDQSKGVSVGQEVRVEGALKTTEWNGKWFTAVDCESLIMTGKMRKPEAAPPGADEGIPF